MSDTPRTDAHNWNEGHYDDPLHSLLDFAKQLERELNAANDRIMLLEEAGIFAIHEAIHGREDDALKIWRKAMEAKP